MKRRWQIGVAACLLMVPTAVSAQGASSAAQLAPNQSCSLVTQANANESAGTPNIGHDGSALPGIPVPDISQGFRGIPRSAQPPLTASQRRILECSYLLDEAQAEMPYTVFVPSSYRAGTPTPLVVDLHGLNITPLMQILFDGTTDFAERHGSIVVAPMGYSVAGWWGARAGNPVETARMKPGTSERYAVGELSEIDAMRVLDMMRENYTIDEDRIYLMGHSMGGAGTYHLGAKYNDVWAGIAPLAGAGGIPDAETAARYRSFPSLIMHGEKDSIVPALASRRAVQMLQSVGAPHMYLEFPGEDHEFWIRRGAEHMEKVFLFFDTVSRRTTVGFITEEMVLP
ncbi:MAG: prolyl oligopeptidase family serine peptidase [Gemmatimonadota bacterium]|nr:prolyl oligopeptidase family serine peptidase [Gemmatimonadota bacterium]MDH3421715.1 prolyl oligopeptidase family serine peptidase [Gemmatimonadota bacterium]